MVSRGILDRSQMPLGKNGWAELVIALLAGVNRVVGVSEGAGQEGSRAGVRASRIQKRGPGVFFTILHKSNAPPNPSFKRKQNEGCEVEEEEERNNARTDWVYNHFYYHPELCFHPEAAG